MLDHFTDQARRTVVLARDAALTLDHDHIGTEHLLIGLLQTGQSLATTTLHALGVTVDDARKLISVAAGAGHPAPGDDGLAFTRRAKRVLEHGLREARRLGHGYIGAEHILLGLLREDESMAAEVLVRMGLDLPAVHAQLLVELQRSHDEPASELVSRHVSPVERLDDTGWEALTAARAAARRRGAVEICSVDLLVGLASVAGPGAEAVRAVGLDRAVLERAVDAVHEGTGPSPAALLFDDAVRDALVRAADESMARYHRAITTAHMLFGLLHRPDAELSMLLDGLGVTVSRLQTQVAPRLRDVAGQEG